VSADVMCKDCGWPIGNRHHDDVHGRMKRYRFDVDGMNFVSVLPWDDWSKEWRSWFAGLVKAQRATDEKNGLQRTTMIYIDNYSAELDSIRWHGVVDLL
jgi:hypothetical protein